MTITIVTGPFYPAPPAPCGAVERRWHHVAERFAAMGHDVTFLCRHWPGQRAEETVGAVRYRRRTRFNQTGRIAIDLMKDLAYSLRMLALLPRADVVVTNTFWLPILIPRLRRRAGRVVVNVARVPKGQVKHYLRADRLAAVSHAIRDAILAECPRAAGRVKVIPNPIDAGVFTPPPRPRDFGGRRVLLYTGRVHPEKGLNVLIGAFARLRAHAPNLLLRVVGPTKVEQGGGGEDHLRSLQRQAAGLPVEFVPPIYDRPRLAEEYRAAHYYCYPSLAERGESFGVAPLEAMATGLVPVVSSLDCFRDFIDETTGAFFDHRADDPAAALADALRPLIDDPVRVREMGDRAAARAAGFSYEDVARAYLEDFESLVHSAPAAHRRAAVGDTDVSRPPAEVRP